MNSEASLKEIDQRIKEAQRMIDFGQSFERLVSNRDFKKVVIEGYFREEAIRLVSIKQNPELQTESSQASILKQIDAIGTFYEYLKLIEFQSDQAKKNLQDYEQMRLEILTEEGAE